MLAAIRAVWANSYVKVLVLAALVFVAFLVLGRTSLIWGSFLAAFVFAYLLSPLVDLVTRRSYPRWLGVLIVAALLLLAFAGIGLLAILVSTQLADLGTQAPGLLDAVNEMPFRLARMIDPSFGAVFHQVFASTQLVSERLAAEVIPSLEGIGIAGVRGAARALSDVGTSLALILVVSLYLLHGFPSYLSAAIQSVPPRHRPFVRNMADKADRSVGGFVRGQLAIALAVGIMTGVALTILGIPLALVLGVLTGVFNLIPFFGPYLVAVPTVILAATVSGWHVLGALGVLVAVNLLDGNVLMPLVYSRTVSVDPVTVIVAILFGASLFGLVGALVAVPVAAFLKVVYVEEIRGRGEEVERGDASTS